MSKNWSDKAISVRKGEELPIQTLFPFLYDFFGNTAPVEILQFPSGFSNLTYLVRMGGREFVLRRPPFGTTVKSGHDMKREFDILSALKPFYKKVPTPLVYSDDMTIMNAPFYLMERVEGVVIRANMPSEMIPKPDQMNAIASSFVDTMIALHSLDLKTVGLTSLGRPNGYVQRQIEGWTKRYYNSKTDEIASVERVAKWLYNNIPKASDRIALIHNDFKYDNLLLDKNNWTEVKAVLDWEMTTTGDPLMDLGTSLGYWVNPNDPDFMKNINLNPTTFPGNYSREELVQQYALKTHSDVDNIVFYYVYGLFKIAGIIQQIYFRYKKGLTQDKRFASLIEGVKAMGQIASQSIAKKQIDNLF